MHHDLSCSDSSSLKRKGLEVCREDTPRPRIAWNRGNTLGKDPRLGKCKIVLLLLAVVTDPIILLVRKLYFFVFGILTLLCWSICVRAEFFYSSILICMFHSLQLCSLKDIKATPKSDGIRSPLNYGKTSRVIFDFQWGIFRFLQFVFNTVWVWYSSGV